MNALIVEDEFHASDRLKKILKQVRPNYEVLDILDTVEDTLEWFNQQDSPDLIFMDIQLADGLSFEIFQHVDVQCPIIFTTAFDQYAIDAFKTNSIDYLLKPIEEDQLFNALKKFETLHSPKSLAFDLKNVEALIQRLSKPKNYRKNFLVKHQSSFLPIQVENVRFFYSEDGLTFLNSTNGKRWIIDQTLDQLESELDPVNFFRVNRKQIIRRAIIQKVSPYFNHRYKLEVSTPIDQEFIVARKRARNFREWIGGF